MSLKETLLILLVIAVAVAGISTILYGTFRGLVRLCELWLDRRRPFWGGSYR